MTKLEDQIRVDQLRTHAKQYEAFVKIFRIQGKDALCKVLLGLADVARFLADEIEDAEFMEEVSE